MATGKKVVIFGSYAPSLVNFRGSLIAAIISRGHRVVAVAPDIDPSTADAIRRLGATPQELEVSNSSLNPISLARSIADLKALLLLHRPDVLLTYTIKPVVVGAFAGKAAGVPKIISLITGAGYAFTEGKQLKRLISRVAAKRLYRLALSRSDWVVFQNGDDEQLFRDMGMVKPDQNVARTHGSGIDLQHYAVAEQPREPSFLMISRLVTDKGIREFAAAAKRLKSEFPEVPVRLVGFFDRSPQAISEDELERMRASGVEFQGFASDVRPAISDCSIYVLPSYREGTPRSVLEAMAMGRAIITTDAPGCRETVEDGINGILVPPRDADALYQAMVRFIRDPGMAVRMGKESRRIAETKYDVVDVNAELLRIAGL